MSSPVAVRLATNSLKSKSGIRNRGYGRKPVSPNKDYLNTDNDYGNNDSVLNKTDQKLVHVFQAEIMRLTKRAIDSEAESQLMRKRYESVQDEMNNLQSRRDEELREAVDKARETTRKEVEDRLRETHEEAENKWQQKVKDLERKLHGAEREIARCLKDQERDRERYHAHTIEDYRAELLKERAAYDDLLDAVLAEQKAAQKRRHQITDDWPFLRKEFAGLLEQAVASCRIEHRRREEELAAELQHEYLIRLSEQGDRLMQQKDEEVTRARRSVEELTERKWSILMDRGKI